MKAGNINLTNDLDTLLVGFQRSGRKQQNYIGIACGPVARKAQAPFLKSASLQTAEVAGRQAYEIDSTLWVSPMGTNRLAIASSSNMLEKFFKPSGHLFERDSTTASLIRKTPTNRMSGSPSPHRSGRQARYKVSPLRIATSSRSAI